MTKNYFSLDENFDEIIKNSLKDRKILHTEQISTGWTNIVYEVQTDNGSFFFRFPRDDFWARTIVKDCDFASYIHGKTDFQTADLKLRFDNGRPFSVHQKIEGTVLADKIDELSDEQLKKISNDIAKFMFELHHIKFDKTKIFSTNNIGHNLTDFLNELLNYHVDPKDKVFWKYDEFSKKDNNCLVHGDLNLSNVLLDDNNNVCAIIDFGFGGFGNKYFDISRIMSRTCPKAFKDEIIKEYETLENQKLDYQFLDNEIDIWSKIDNSYINYMRKIGIYA